MWNQQTPFVGATGGGGGGTGDIDGVLAGTGISGGGTSGTVTLSLDQAVSPSWTGTHTWANPLRAPAGDATAPGYTITGDTNTGLFGAAADTPAISAGGVEQVRWASAQTLPPLGSAGAPSYSFIGDVNTGVFSSAADTVDISAGGTSRVTVTTTVFTTTNPHRGPDGTASAPTYSFTSDTNTGAFSSAADAYGIATGGTERVTVSTTAVTSTLVYVAPAGLTTAPGYSTAGDLNTGVWFPAADTVAISAGGTEHARWAGGQIVAGTLGSAGTPAWSFTGDLNTGIFSSGADAVDISAGGTSRVTVSTGAVTATVVYVAPAGTTSLPSYSTAGDLDTGFWFPAANTVALSVGGTEQVRWAGAQIVAGSLGSAGTPSWTFTGDLNTGIFSSGADALDISAGGTARLTVSTTANTGTVPFVAPAASAGAPGLTFTGETDCGFYISGTNGVGCATNGVSRWTCNTTTFAVTTVIALPQGTVTAPSLTATGDTNTGLYFVGADDIALTAGGTQRIRANATGLGFFAVTPVARPDVTGSRATGAAYTSLITAMANLGLCTDSSTA